MYTYKGNIHIHSTHSDGSAGIDLIARAAAKAGARYIVITDHETLRGLPEEGLRHGVVVLVGTEFNRNCNHYLGLGLEKMLPANEARPQALIDRVRAAGGLGFIAHPFERGSPYIGAGRAYPWTHWPVERFTGLEIWNYSSHWRGRARSARQILYWYFCNRNAAVADGPPTEVLRLWDCYTARGRKVVGIGSTDAHAAPFRLGPFTIEVFPYEFLFRTINTYVILPGRLRRAFAPAKRQILAALGEGRCYLSFDGLHEGSGFRFYARCGAAEIQPGGEVSFRPGISLAVVSPARRSLIRLLRNGVPAAEVSAPALRYAVTRPGVYRAEVFYRLWTGRPRPWIYANPIYITG